jgi:hypothetical protein
MVKNETGKINKNSTEKGSLRRKERSILNVATGIMRNNRAYTVAQQCLHGCLASSLFVTLSRFLPLKIIFA